MIMKNNFKSSKKYFLKKWDKGFIISCKQSLLYWNKIFDYRDFYVSIYLLSQMELNNKFQLVLFKFWVLFQVSQPRGSCNECSTGGKTSNLNSRSICNSSPAKSSSWEPSTKTTTFFPKDEAEVLFDPVDLFVSGYHPVESAWRMCHGFPVVRTRTFCHIMSGYRKASEYCIE